MLILYSKLQFNQAKCKDLLPLKCSICFQTYYRKKEYIRNCLNPKRRDDTNTCSIQCLKVFKTKKVRVQCKTCQKSIEKHPSQLKIYPLSFCNKSCASKYSNSHKTKGYQRSKLELWIESQLNIMYPNLKINYNDKQVIASELDIYIPSLKLAFEINGIFHYEPIFGEDKLCKTQENDNRKFLLCQQQNISLCIIDSSKLKYFKEERGLEYLKIVTDIINSKLL